MECPSKRIFGVRGIKIRAVWFFVGLVFGMTGAAPPPRADFFVAPDGRDAWSGRLASSDAHGVDGPFASLARAKEAVRQLHSEQKKQGKSAAITVLVRGGNYFLTAPLVFTPEDSGAADAPVVYAAYPGETPTLSGGVPLQGWTRDADGASWTRKIPEVAEGKWAFAQLFVNGQRRPRPRWPKQGYAKVDGELPPSEKAKDKGFDRFSFPPGAIRGDWHDRDAVEVLPFHIWNMSRFRIAEVDEGARSVTFHGATPGAHSWLALGKGTRFLVENVREALDSPGEWYLDRKTGTLTYRPRVGENPSNCVVIAPRLPFLIQLQGDVAHRRWVEHLEFRGLTLAHTNWTIPENGTGFTQAEAEKGAAFRAEGARQCLFAQGAIRQVGAYAVEWGSGCRENRLEGCDLTDLGAGGVKIGTMSFAQDEEAVAAGNVIRDNLIAGGGRLHPAAVGIWIGQSHGNLVEHNEIRDFYYTGISVGWSWGYGPSRTHHNRIEENLIHELGQGVLSDLGGIYTLGVSPGTVLRGNQIHDVRSYDYGGWGIYFDEGTTDLLAVNNLVYRTKTGSFHQHYGKDNLVENNIFAESQNDQVMRTRAESHRSFTFRHNLVFWSQGRLLGGNWSGGGFAFHDNLYWDTRRNPVRFGDLTWEQWKAAGQDLHSQVADPLFRDPAHGDFRLREGSPALEVGFQPFDLTTSGLVTGSRLIPEVPRAFPPSSSSP